MSAREELFEALMPAYRAQYAPGEEGSTTALLDAYRAEALRERAEAAREFMGPEEMEHESETVAQFVRGWLAAVRYMAQEVTND